MKKRLLSFVLAVLMIASLLPATALAAGIVDSGTCGAEVTWTLDSEGVLTISGSGDMYDYYSSSGAPWHGSSSRVKSAVIADGVTSIGEKAFCDCSSLTSVTIPNSVTSIGERAFSECTSLTSVTIPDSVTCIGMRAFFYCTSLTSVTIPDSVTSIGQEAFYKCESLTSVTIPGSVTSIGVGAFALCKSLTSVTIPNSVTSINYETFRSCESLTSVTIPDSVTSIDMSAFCGCSSLTSVTIPDSVTNIGSYAFSECTSLTSVTIPDSVTRIGEYAFSECTSLTSVTIPGSVTSIGVGAFASCTSLTGIWVAEGSSHYSSDASGVLFNKDKTTLVQCPGAFSGSYAIPNSVTSIGGYAFDGCASLTSVTIPDGVTSIGGWAFRGCTSLTSVTIPDSVTSIGKWAFSECKSLTSVTIPGSVTSIGVGAFASCTSLTGIWVAEGSSYYASDASGVLFNKDMTTLVQCPGAFAAYTIPDSVTRIGERAFYYCTSLTSVTIPNSVRSIGKWAFRGCSSLTSVTIPNSVTSIDDGTFASCTSLTSVTIPNSVTYFGEWAFDDCTSLTDVYYAGSKAQWKAISISSAGNGYLLAANIHYNYGSHTHSYKDVVTAPTCTAKGYTTHTCACGDSYVDTYVDALGHAWDNGKVTKEPTETETGVKTFTCTRCGETKTETIPKLTHEHNYNAVVTAPTCTEKGYTTHTCACGDSYVDTYVDALGHAWDAGKVTEAPTETKTGVKTFTCTRCNETKTESIPVVSVDVTQMFSDVTKNWAYPGIQYCVTHKLMGSTGGDKFAPTMTTTRAQIVQILYNLEGEPKVSGTTPFTDLTQDWYQDAVLWAYQTGVVAGTSSTTFEPDLPVTREQIAVILMEYITRVLKLERTWTPADLSTFPDAGSVSDWAKDALADAVALGLISGASNGGQTLLEPQGSATREQVATILMEFCKNVKK